MARCMKCGGSKKMKAGGSMKSVPSGSKYNGLRSLPTTVRNKMGYAQEGMSVYDIGGIVMPMYTNNPRFEQGRILKYGGSCGKVYSAKQFRKRNSF